MPCAVPRGFGGDSEGGSGAVHPDGAALGGVSGFTLKRASRSALLGSGVDELLYEVVWRAGSPVGLRAAAFLAGPAALASGLGPADTYLEAEGVEREGLVALVRELEREARHYALRGLEELGWERTAGDRFETEEAAAAAEGDGDYRRLFGRLLGLMDEAGVLSRDPTGGWVVTAGSEEPLPETLGAPEEPAGSIEWELLRRCGSSLSEILRGRADPLELLFGEEVGAADLYGKSPGARGMNRLVGDAVASAAAGLPAGRRLRVLEVGAGTGATTAAVLGGLPAGGRTTSSPIFRWGFLRKPSGVSRRPRWTSAFGRWTSSGIRGSRVSRRTDTTW